MNADQQPGLVNSLAQTFQFPKGTDQDELSDSFQRTFLS